MKSVMEQVINKVIGLSNKNRQNKTLLTIFFTVLLLPHTYVIFKAVAYFRDMGAGSLKYIGLYNVFMMLFSLMVLYVIGYVDTQKRFGELGTRVKESHTVLGVGNVLMQGLCLLVSLTITESAFTTLKLITIIVGASIVTKLYKGMRYELGQNK